MDAKEILAKLAPTAAALIGGPLAGVAVQAIGSAIGLDAPTEKKIADAFTQGSMTGDQIAAVKKAELEVQAHLQDNDIKLEDLEFQDRKSARDMQIATRALTPSILATVVTIGFFGCIGVLMTRVVPPENANVLYLLIGVLGSAWGTIIQFNFGSSKDTAHAVSLLSQAPAIPK